MANDPPVPSSLIRAPLAPVERDPDDPSGIESEDELTGLNRVITEIEGEDAGSKVIIWRKNPNNPRTPMVWLDELAPSAFSIKWLAETYGGGTYNVRVFVPQMNPDGTKSHKVKCAANKLITIDGAPKVKRFEEPAAAPVAPQTDLAAVLTAFEKSQQRMMETIIQAVNRPQEDVFTVLEKIERLKKIVGGDSPRASGFDQMREFMDMLKDIEETRAARDSGDNGMLMLLGKKFLDRFDQLERGAPAPALEAPAVPPAAPAAPAVPVATAAANLTGSEDEAMFENQMREFYIRQLIGKAKAKTDPIAFAPEVVEMADVRLIAFLQTETWFEEIVKVNKEAVLYKTFFHALRDEILRLVNERQAGQDA